MYHIDSNNQGSHTNSNHKAPASNATTSNDANSNHQGNNDHNNHIIAIINTAIIITLMVYESR